jgi:EAL domain-containing protein (putative c-di-GMP-specific phosphodiesterase class I)
MDDFGTGYSSLKYLRLFPFDKLKVDRSFVQDAVDSGDSRAILQTVATLGRSLRITTLAEGVETKRQLMIVKKAGFDAAQGYLFSPPVRAGEVPRLLEKLRSAAEVKSSQKVV